MKIAAITDDGVTISQHFGRAPYYVVYTLVDEKIVDRELREKLGHAQFQQEGGHDHHDHTHSGGGDGNANGHGYGPAAESRHARMAASITDCTALLCRGMGWGAYESLKEHGITPIVTDISDMEAAVLAYVDGTIEDLRDRLH